MNEKPREYKERIDKQRSKRRINRDKLIECIQEYELVDEKYKAKTKQEILANFDKNEKAEKSEELYVKVGEELSNIDLKYKELRDLKEKLDSKRQDNKDLNNELKKQNVDGKDKTTLKLQMQKIDSINSKLEKIEGEIETLEKEVKDRENEIKEIEEMYGKKEDLNEVESEEINIPMPKPQVETTKKESPGTLQEYKETVLSEKGKIDSTKGKIIELLEEGTGIDETLKEKIKQKISDVFKRYNDEIEGSLRMKSAGYMEERESILNFDTTLETNSINGKECLMNYSEQFDNIGNPVKIGGKPCFRVEKDGKECIMRGNEQYSDWSDRVWDPIEIGGKPCFPAEKDGKQCVMRGTEQYSEWFDEVGEPVEVGGKLCFRVEKDGKECVMLGNKQYSEWFDEVGDPVEIKGNPCFTAKKDGKECVMLGNKQYSKRFNHAFDPIKIGGKPCFSAEKDGKRCIMLGNKQYSKRFNHAFDPIKIGGKPCFVVEKDGKQCIMRGTEQYSDWSDRVWDPIEIGGKPCFPAEKDGKQCVMRGTEQYSEWFDEVGDPVEIGGKPCFQVLKDGKYCIMRGTEQYSEWFDEIGEPVEVGGKPCFRVLKDGKYCIMRGKEQYSGWFDEYNYASLKMEELKIKSKYENITETSREKREKIILERYQKKLNRDELLKIISGIETMDDNGKKTLKSEILSDFIVELKKAISTEGFKELDKEYRELKKSERQKTKKLAELETQVEISKPEVTKLDEKLCEIANSAMKLEDDSRLKIIKSNRLKKTKEEWNNLESRLNEILDKVKEIDKEEVELIGIYLEKEKKYGKMSERPKIKGKVLSKDIVATEKLEGESTLLGHKKAYMELANDKEKYIDDLLKEIETTDFGISNEKKKDVMEKLKISLEKELETFKEGDDITKLADETEKWLKENWNTLMEQMKELSRKIQEKEKEIKKLKSKGTGDNSKKIYKIKQREFILRDEILDLKDKYESIKTKIDEKLKNYDGTVIDWTKGITLGITWEERRAIPFIDMGINPKDLTLHGELLNKPIYIYKDSDGSFILFRGDKKIRLGTAKIIEIKNIGGDIVLKTKNSDGYYSVFRGDKECYGSRRGIKDKYKEIYDIHEVDGKPIFLALDSDGYYSIIIGDEKYEGDKNYRGNLAEGYYEKEIKEDLEKKQYTNITQGYKIIGWEK